MIFYNIFFLLGEWVNFHYVQTLPFEYLVSVQKVPLRTQPQHLPPKITPLAPTPRKPLFSYKSQATDVRRTFGERQWDLAVLGKVRKRTNRDL